MTETLTRPHIDDTTLADEEYQEVLDLLLMLRRLDPNTRLGQLLCNMTLLVLGPDAAVWDLEDADLKQGLVRQIASFERAGREPVIV